MGFGSCSPSIAQALKSTSSSYPGCCNNNNCGKGKYAPKTFVRDGKCCSRAPGLKVKRTCHPYGIATTAGEASTEEEEGGVPTTTDSSRLISRTELAEHTSSHSIWLSLFGDVYDVSAWLNRHPGGRARLLTFAGQVVPPSKFPHARSYLATHKRFVVKVGRLGTV